MTFKDIQELIRMVSKSDLAEVKIKDGEFELSIRTRHYSLGKSHGSFMMAPPAPEMPASFAPPPATSPASSTAAPKPVAQPAPAGSAEAPVQPAGGDGDYLGVKSPMVGTFYRSSSPDKPPYVKVGDLIEAGQVVCIVEAMKLFNEIESEISGRVVKVVVEDAQPVEYDQVLFLIDPKG
ncbi:MAG: acetyl-CoA carboxylase biotin carboxyl carrier protein [Saprospiraceae bacterium]|nr:acetyl-CoA carboxylase biotin carboxyl carrier protein [Saprospiraceae bacterium]